MFVRVLQGTSGYRTGAEGANAGQMLKERAWQTGKQASKEAKMKSLREESSRKKCH